MEVLTTAIIVAIVASLAIASYTRTVENGRRSRGETMLRTIYSAQERYHIKNRTYTTSWNNLGMTQPVVDDFVFSLTAAGATTFTAQAVWAGRMTLTINQTGTLTET